MQTTLLTGFPSYLTKRMIRKILAGGERDRLFVLVRHQEAAEATEFTAALPAKQQKRVTVLIGDVTAMDLGLSGQEYRGLTTELSEIHHIAGRYHLGATKEEIQQFNVGGTRGAIELALECRKLRRFTFWSTVFVSGDREGVVMEDELECQQKFRNEYEHSKYAAEKIVRSMSRRLPSTIVRPGIIVGDSRTGELERYDGPYRLMTVLMNSPFDLQLPLPGRGVGPFHLVPVDYVIDAGYLLSRREEAVSKTFHLVDPCPLSARAVYELVADRVYRKVPSSVIPPGVARALLRVPWIGKLRGSPRTIMEGFNQQVYYSCRNTLEALRQTDVWCPPFESYVDNLVRFVKDVQLARRRREEDVVDPLE